MIQFVDLPKETQEQLDLAIDRSMEHGDQVIMHLESGEAIVLIFDGTSGTITGWLEDDKADLDGT